MIDLIEKKKGGFSCWQLNRNQRHIWLTHQSDTSASLMSVSDFSPQGLFRFWLMLLIGSRIWLNHQSDITDSVKCQVDTLSYIRLRLNLSMRIDHVYDECM